MAVGYGGETRKQVEHSKVGSKVTEAGVTLGIYLGYIEQYSEA